MAKKVNFERIKKYFFSVSCAQNEAVFGKQRECNLILSKDTMFLHKNHKTQICAKKAKVSF